MADAQPQVLDELKGVQKAVTEKIEKVQSQFHDLKTELKEDAERTKKSLTKSQDGVTREKIDKMTDVISRAEESKQQLQRRMDALQAALNRSGPGANDDGSMEAKAERFAAQCGTYTKTGSPPDDFGAQHLQEYKKAFNSYIRNDERTLSSDEVKALSIGNDGSGGYLTTPEVDQEIRRRVIETSPVRQFARVIEMGADSHEFPVRWTAPQVKSTSEKGSRSSTSTPEIKLVKIDAKELYAFPLATQRMLDDGFVNVEAFIEREVADEIGRQEADQVFNGDGSSEMRGILTYDTPGTPANDPNWGEISQVKSGANGSVTYSGLVDIMTALKTPYMANAAWLFPRTVFAEILKLTGDDDNPLWQPQVEAAAPRTLLGHDYALAEDLPDAATNSLSIVFGDFDRGYTIGDRTGVSVLRDPYSEKPYVGFYTIKRTGGGVTDFDALKIGKLAT